MLVPLQQQEPRGVVYTCGYSYRALYTVSWGFMGFRVVKIPAELCIGTIRVVSIGLF